MVLCGPVLRAQSPLYEAYYSGGYKQVIEEGQKQLALGQAAEEIYLLVSLSEIQTGRILAAISTLKEAESLYPGHPSFSRMLAEQYYRAGLYPEARDAYLQLLENDSTDMPASFKLAEIASFKQEQKDVIKRLEPVLLKDSTHLPALMLMGETLNRLKKPEAACFYEQANRLYPHNQKTAYALGNWYIQNNKADSAITVCNAILERDSVNIRFVKLLAYANYKAGHPHKGASLFTLATALGDSTNFSFRYGGICRYLVADYAEAIHMLEIAINKDSLDAEVHYFLGTSLGTTTRKEEAIFHLDRALTLMQPNPSAVSSIYSEWGNIKRLQSEYEEAYILYEKAWCADTSKIMSLYFMASIQDNSLDNEKLALEDYQLFIKMLDQNPLLERTGGQGPSVRDIVEDRIIYLREELFFKDED